MPSRQKKYLSQELDLRLDSLCTLQGLLADRSPTVGICQQVAEQITTQGNMYSSLFWAVLNHAEPLKFRAQNSAAMNLSAVHQV